MATAALGPLSARFAIFNPSRVSTLLTVIHKLWLAAGATYCVDRLYRAYQVHYHPQPKLLLDNNLKLIKYMTTIKGGISSPRLDECENQKSFKNPAALLEIVKCCASNSCIDKAFIFAKKLSSGEDLLNAAQLIRNNPVSTFAKYINELVTLLTNALNTGPSSGVPEANFTFYLDLAKAFHSLRKMSLRDQAFSQATTILPSLNLVTSFCETAGYCREFGMEEKVNNYLSEAEDLCAEEMLPADLISAYLTLANTFFFLLTPDKKEFYLKKMDLMIDKVLEQLSNNQNVIIKTQNLPRLATFLEKITGSDSKHEYCDTVDLLTKTHGFVFNNATTSCERAEAYFSLAASAQIFGYESSTQEYTLNAYSELEKVVQDSSIALNVKKNLLLKAFDYESLHDKLFDLVQKHEDLRELPFRIGNTLNPLNEKMKGQARHQAWFDGYFQKIKDAQITPKEKITELTVGTDNQNYFTPKQIKILLEAAESLLSQVRPSQRAEATAKIAKGYLHIDVLANTFALFHAYEKWLAPLETKKLVTTAVATLVFMGISWVYPRTTPFLGATLGLVHRFL